MSETGSSFMIQKFGFGTINRSKGLNELFLWKNEPESEELTGKGYGKSLRMFCLCSYAGGHGLDVSEIVKEKTKNAWKYPIEKCKGSSRKYKDINSQN